MKTNKKILAIILAVALILTLMPAMALAGDNPAIKMGAPTKGEKFRFGSVQESWRALNSGVGALFVIAETVGDWTQFSEDSTSSTANVWAESKAQKWCRTFYKDKFSSGEKRAILNTTKSEEGNYTSTSSGIEYGPASLNGEYVFFLSAKEADRYFSNDEDRIANATDGQSQQWWWLRSLSAVDPDFAGVVSNEGHVNYNIVDDYKGARPAFNLDLSSVLFSSAAAGGKSSGDVGAGALKEISTSDVSVWKLTLDDGRSFSAQAGSDAVLSQEEGYSGWTVPVEYSGGKTESNEYVSTILCDADGKALYYGNIAQSSVSGTVNLTIPEGLSAGTYTLNVFSEQKNTDNATDFASAFKDITLEVTEKTTACTVSFETNGGSSVEAQTITKGGTATKPEDPTRDGYKLLDWFEDEACTKRFDFTKAIDGDTTVYAYWAKLVNGFKLHADGTEKDSGGNYKLKTDALEVLFEKDTAKVGIEVSPLSTDRDNSSLLTTEPEKDKEYWFHVVINDVDGVEDETLGRPTIWTGDEMKAGLDATAEDAVITFDEVMHSPAGKYTTLIFKYKENEPAPEPEPEPKPEPEPEPEPQPEPEPVPEVKPVYWVSEGTDLTVSEDTAEGLKLTVHRKPGDDLTFSLFTGAEMDGKQLSSSDYNAASGSLKLTVKPSYIQGLKVGSHTLKVKFSDGEVTANVKVTEANDNPKTGDESGLMLWILIAVIAAGGIIAALLVYRKQSKRE